MAENNSSLKNSVSLFSQYNIDRAKEEIAQVATTDLAESRKMFNGDHWLGGEGWVGPTPTEASVKPLVMPQIEKEFVSANTIAEVVIRHSDSLLARVGSGWAIVPKRAVTLAAAEAPRTGLASTLRKATRTLGKIARGKKPGDVEDDVDPAKTAEDERTTELMEMLGEWWTTKNVSHHLQEAVEHMLYGGRGGLRLFVPQGKLQGNTLPRVDLRQALELIYLDSPSPDSAILVTDTGTMESVYLHVYRKRSQAAQREFEYAEIAFVDPATGLTSIKLESDDPDLQKGEVIADLGKRNIFFEMKRKPLITPQVRKQQKMLNMNLTMMARNVVLGGYLERTVINADLPGEFIDDSRATGGKRYVPKKLEFGGGRVTSLKGIVLTDSEGNETMTTPDIRYRDPIKVDTFVETHRQCYHTILQSTEQSHMIMAGDAFASGEARIQARANYATSLLRSKPQVDSLIAWLLETVLSMASFFAGQVAQFTDLKVVSDIKPDTGPLTPEEKRVVIEMYKGGLISREATMVILGVDNPEEEIAKIESEKRITTPAELAGIFTALSKTGWQLSMAQLPEVDENILGLKPRDVEEYKKELEWQAKLAAPTGGNAGERGGSPQGSVNKPKTDDPGPGAGSE